jgi:hypothetical protein
MKQQSAVTILVVMNILLSIIIFSNRAIVAQNEPGVLLGRALELVDSSGQIRAQINVEDDGQVVLRLRDETGAIRVKVGADQNGSGFVLMDEATQPAIQMIARQKNGGATTSITLRGSGGQDYIILPSQQ